MTDAPDVYVVLDANDPERLAEFWCEALRYRRVNRIEQYVVLLPPEGTPGFAMLVQGVGDPKAAKNRMHLDLHVADPDAEVARLVTLGATAIGPGSIGEIHWTTMADPEGNEFCIGLKH